MKKLVSIVIPAYNEADNLSELVKVLDKILLERNKYEFQYLFVNDGSIDDSLNVIEKLSTTNQKVKYISFAKNFGKDAALKAGIDLSNADIIITMDADLQHPPVLINQMLAKWEEGYDVIYAYRSEANPHTSRFHKIFSRVFYKVVNSLSDINLEDGISDFRLIDSKVANHLKNINEYEIFLRGMIKWVGFKQIGLPYIPSERFSGNTAYSKRALIKLALHGITSFSIKPLYTAVYLGFSFSFASILYIPYVLYSYFAEIEVSGWASTIMTIVFFGGLQLIILGIIGIYVGKMFMQTKNRPNYIIQTTNLQNN